MKRPSSPARDVERRKSRRLQCRDEAKRPFLQKQGLDFFSRRSVDLGLQSPYLSLDLYNKFLPLAQNHAALHGASAPVRHAERVGNVAREIQEEIELTLARLEVKFAQLERHTNDFAKTTLALSEAYEGGDLLSLTLPLMKVAMQCFEVWEANRFGDYVYRIVEESQRSPQSKDERDWDDHDDIGGNPFVEKVFLLVQRMIDQDLGFEAFHVVVLLKSLYHRENDRIPRRMFFAAHRKIDLAIRRFADESQIPDRDREGCDKDQNPTDHEKHDCMVRTACLYWYSGPGTHVDIFHDHASAARRVRETYHNLQCGSQRWHRDEEDDDCYHVRAIDLLDWLQKKAWCEVRAKALQTVGSILPAELTELIIDYALEVEEVPAQPSTKEWYSVEASNHDAQSKKQKTRYVSKPRFCERTKEQYKCKNIRDRDPDYWYDSDGNLMGPELESDDE